MGINSNIMKALIAILFILNASAVYAQVSSTDSLQWQVEQLTDTNTDQTSEFTCVFTTSPSTVLWVQNGGEDATTFPVTSVSGNWNNVENDGTITFNVTFQNKPGEITFSRAGGQIRVSMNFVQEQRNTTPYIFTVSTITNL
jgi:hypothetical protein